jgi:hypothetical protein
MPSDINRKPPKFDVEPMIAARKTIPEYTKIGEVFSVFLSQVTCRALPLCLSLFVCLSLSLARSLSLSLPPCLSLSLSASFPRSLSPSLPLVCVCKLILTRTLASAA